MRRLLGVAAASAILGVFFGGWIGEGRGRRAGITIATEELGPMHARALRELFDARSDVSSCKEELSDAREAAQAASEEKRDLEWSLSSCKRDLGWCRMR